MKIAGKILDIVTGEVVLPRGEGTPLKLKLRALPIGAEEKVLELFPAPRPPREYAEKKGNVLRDKEGKPIYEEKLDDPNYRAAQRRSARLTSVYFAREGLRADETIVFETPEDLLAKNPVAYYEAIDQELRGSGLLPGDLALIVEQVLELSNFDRRKVEAARELFSSAGAGEAGT